MAKKKQADTIWNELDFAQRRLVLEDLCGIVSFEGPKSRCQKQCAKMAKPVSRLLFKRLTKELQKDLNKFYKSRLAE